MRITYGFVYYFTILTAVLTVTLAILYFKAIRNFVFRMLNNLKLGDFSISKMLLILSLCIIGIVMIDAIASYMHAKQSLGSLDGFKIDSFEEIKSDEKETYLNIYKKLREFYMAQRNFMLTASALLILFIFNRFLAAFKKLYDMEKQYSNKVKVV